MQTSPNTSLIFAGLIALWLLYYGISGLLSSKMNLRLLLRVFYFIRIPYGRITLAGVSATVASLGCLVPGVLLGLLIAAYLLHKTTVSADILLGLSFVAVLVAALGMILAFIVKTVTGR